MKRDRLTLVLVGYGGAGKDSLHDLCREFEPGLVRRLALGDALKARVDDDCQRLHGISAFTDDRAEKAIIRPFLEAEGMRLRDELLPELLKQAQGPGLAGRLTFITRAQDLAEVRRWMAVGGEPVLVVRPGHPAASPAEERQVREIARALPCLLVEAEDLMELRTAARYLLSDACAALAAGKSLRDWRWRHA